ncbi:MAG: tetratricopeptide repeat protein [Parachlamydiales bacterium]|jgi:tetratricopeptide (TPR) repeat protein
MLTNYVEEYSKAKKLYENGLYKEAKKIFVDLTLKNPFVWELWFSLSAIYQLENNYQQAISCYNIASVIDPQNPHIYFHLAECHLSINDRIKALDYLLLSEKNCNDIILKDKILILKEQNYNN